MVKVEVEQIVLNLATRSPVVILRSKTGEVLPIVIGFFEAQSILVFLEKAEFPRPLTHDLIRRLLEEFGCKMLRLEIHTLKENVYYADIVLETKGEIRKMDCRPSDGIAVALRFGSAIYASEDLMEPPDAIRYYEGNKFIRSNELDKPIDAKEAAEFRRVMEQLSSQEFWRKLKEAD